MTDGTPPHWSADDLALIEARWAAGDSGAEIALLLKGRHTRNAVMGKIMRLRGTGSTFKPRDSKFNRDNRHRRQQVAISKPKPPKISPPQTAASDAPAPCGKPGEFPDHGCQFIAGPYSADFIMCGSPLEHGKWCKYHWALVRPQPIPRPVRNGAFRSDGIR